MRRTGTDRSRRKPGCRSGLGNPRPPPSGRSIAPREAGLVRAVPADHPAAPGRRGRGAEVRRRARLGPHPALFLCPRLQAAAAARRLQAAAAGRRPRHPPPAEPAEAERRRWARDRTGWPAAGHTPGGEASHRAPSALRGKQPPGPRRQRVEESRILPPGRGRHLLARPPVERWLRRASPGRHRAAESGYAAWQHHHQC